MLPFLEKFKKDISKLENVNLDARPPTFWYSVGNLAINRIISGSYRRGVPQGRATAIVGPSDSGKSFVLSNCMKAAQDEGAFVLAIDSENALDYNYLRRVGVKTNAENFLGIGVVTVSDTVEVLSEWIGDYIKEYGRYNAKGPKVFIGIDSLSMLLTEAENEHFESGEQRGDQGQQAKQVKHFLKTMVSRMKMTNMSLVATAHVYGADPLKGEGLYSVTPALRYACSQILLVTKLRLREEVATKGKDKDIIGIRLKAETFKSRFAKLGSRIEIEVPYDRGLDPHNGLLEMMLYDDVVTQGGAYYTLDYPGLGAPIKFMKRDLSPEIIEKMLNHPSILEREALFDEFNDAEEEEPEQLPESKKETT